MEYKCKFCQKVYKSVYEKNNRINLQKHTLYCELNPERILYECKYCNEKKENGAKLGAHVSNCTKNPNYEDILKSKKEKGREGRPHTDEAKKKISDGRKKYLLENPDKVPYLLNHSRQESYPEKYFTEVFKNRNFNLTKKYRVGLYELDFCIPDKKIDIEIDGNQHYYDEKIVESDKRRNKFLEDDGWDVIRINWSEYQKLNFDEKNKYILNLKNYVNDLIDTKPFFEVPIKEKKIKEKKQRVEKKKYKNKSSICKHCGNRCSFSKDRCEPCYRKQSRKVERPSLDQLKIDIENLGYSGTGRKYGVSDNSIRKWMKSI